LFVNSVSMKFVEPIPTLGNSGISDIEEVVPVRSSNSADVDDIKAGFNIEEPATTAVNKSWSFSLRGLMKVINL